MRAMHLSEPWRTVAERLGMRPHPEGGWYVETWRSERLDRDGRALASAILFLLPAGEQSHWHRVDADELWQWSAGAALELRIASDAAAGAVTAWRLGDAAGGETPQIAVPAGAWQSASPLGAWSLVGCVVAPAFTFDGFELAPPGWAPAVGRQGQPSRQ